MGVKQRANRNKTLILTKDERSVLRRGILVGDELGKEKLSIEEIKNTTIFADLLDILDKLPNAFADLIIVDPPYNLNKNFNGLKFTSSNGDEYLEYLRTWFSKVVAKLKPNGSLYLCGDWKCTAYLHQVMIESLYVINRITWQREKGRGAMSNWKNGMEDIWFGVADPNSFYFNVEAVKQKKRVIAPYKEEGRPKDWEETDAGKFRLTFPSNFWDDISVPYWSMPENTDHPTQKPEKLLAKLILASCPVGGIVFDPFLGSGTTSVVAKKLERNYVGVEINLEYVLLAEKRLEQATEDKDIQGYVDGVFWERNTVHEQKRARKKIVEKKLIQSNIEDI